MKRRKTLISLCSLTLLASAVQSSAQNNITVFADSEGSFENLSAEAASANPPEHGMNILRTVYRYNKVLDLLEIRIEFDGVAGDVDGDGNSSTGTNDVADFGVGESFGLAVDIDCDGNFDWIFGVSSAGQLTGTTNIPLTSVNFVQSSAFENSFGSTTAPTNAVLHKVPSAADPSLLIRIGGWSSLGANAEQFRAASFAYSSNDIRDLDGMYSSANVNFSARAQAREFDFAQDVGIHPGQGGDTGWDILETIFGYDPVTDEMNLRIKFNGIAGDADGDGDPGNWSVPVGGNDVPNLGEGESIAVAFDVDEDGTFDYVAGVPASSDAGLGLSGVIDPNDLSVHIRNFSGSGSASNLGTSFGTAIGTPSTAVLAHNPSASEPEFVLTISHWSRLTISPFQFKYRAFAGSFVDAGYGEDNQINDIALDAVLLERMDDFTDPNDVGVTPGAPGTGWDFKKLDFKYEPVSDKLTIDIKFFFIAGDADANGDPGAMAANLPGVDVADLGNGESICVYLDIDSDGVEDVVVGVPRSGVLDTSTLLLDLAAAIPGATPGDFGPALSVGAQAFAGWNPSSTQSDFQITIHGWSLVDTDAPHDFGLRAFAGSFVDAGFGEDNIPNPGLPPLEAKLNPDPTATGFELDPVDGSVTITFLSAEEACHNIVQLGAGLNPGNGTVAIDVVDLLDDQVVTPAGEFFTDFLGESKVKVDLGLVQPLRAFFRVDNIDQN